MLTTEHRLRTHFQNLQKYTEKQNGYKNVSATDQRLLQKKKLNKYANTLTYGKTLDLAAKWEKVIAINLHTTDLYIHVHESY